MDYIITPASGTRAGGVKYGAVFRRLSDDKSSARYFIAIVRELEKSHLSAVLLITPSAGQLVKIPLDELVWEVPAHLEVKEDD